MTRLEQLIQEICPDGVSYRTLRSLGKFYSGLTCKRKDDFTNGNAKFITYKNVYSNPDLDLNTDDRVQIAPDENQRTLQYGDVIFTGSSETPDECGMSSVVTRRIDEPVYLNSFCFIFRFNDLSVMLPDFAKHLFRSDGLRYQIGKTASGVTRYNVSKKLMEDVQIPIPPLPVQQEIVNILDKFTGLTKELAAELAARKRQYEYYRDKLLAFDATDPKVAFVNLRDIATVTRGGNFQKKDFTAEGVPCIHYGQIYTHYGISTKETIRFVSAETARKSKQAAPGDIVMAVTSENVEDVCKCVAWMGDENIAVSGHTAIIHHKQNPKYLSYYFHTTMFYTQKVRLAHGTKVIEVTPDSLYDVVIPLPPIEEQNRIVETLDCFDALCNDITEGVPAEIATRKKQYEYYRDKLLTFTPAE